jgi:phosphoribosylformylglycinamidine synthase
VQDDDPTSIVVGAEAGARPELGQSLWLDICHGRADGTPPPVDLGAERRHGEFVRELIAEGYVTAVHDVSDGGVLVAVAEMALAGNVGAVLKLAAFEDEGDRERYSHAWSLFGEGQGRYLVTERFDSHVVEKMAREAGIPCSFIGWTGGESIVLGAEGESGAGEVALADLRQAHEAFFQEWMEA